MNLKNGKVFTSKFVCTGPSSYEKRIYWAAVSQRLRNTDLVDHSASDITVRQPQPIVKKIHRQFSSAIQLCKQLNKRDAL